MTVPGEGSVTFFPVLAHADPGLFGLRGIFTATAILILLALPATSFVATGHAGWSHGATEVQDPVPCFQVRQLPGIGPGCIDGDGLIHAYTEDGAYLGATHGGDPVPEPGQATDLPGPGAGTPICVEEPLTELGGYALVIYARAHDGPDRYDEKAPVIRDLVRSSDALVDASGLETGVPASLKVACQAGQITVVEAVLPTDLTQANWATIMGDLRNMGFDRTDVKHWVYYDDRGACWCGGIANFYGDDRLTLQNANNGFGSSPMYSITFGYDSVRIMLHELGHNMGAVQLTAPNTSGAAHCIDGWDIMCYNDGGSRSHLYTTSVCDLPMPWDCNNDDYFNTNPEPGSYLANHWNLGHAYNRFIAFGV